MHFKTLRFRINAMTIIYSIIIILFSSVIMFGILSEAMDEKLFEDQENQINRMLYALDNDLRQLNSVSLLFTPYGNLGEAIIRFHQLDDIGEKGIQMSRIKADMTVIDFSNPDINLCLFYMNDPYTDFIATSNAVNTIDFDTLPVLFETDTLTYYGPHETVNRINKDTVISVKRPINMGLSVEHYAYVECDFRNIRSIMTNMEANDDYIHVLLNHLGEIVYSTNPDFIKTGLVFDHPDTYDRSVYAIVPIEMPQNLPYSFMTFVNQKSIQTLQRHLVIRYLRQYPIFLILGILFSFLLVNSLSRPMQRFREGIMQLETGDFDTLVTQTGIDEFDTLIAQIHKAKLKISILIDTVKAEEQKRAFAEVSRLRAQINPHFILNTLNTLHWMALKENQTQMDKVIVSLTKILAFNLKKDRDLTTLGEEIEATCDYLELQQLKYQITYQVSNHLGDEVMQVEIPRFILQPLVENSILHGKSDAIQITIDICMTEFGLKLCLVDQGGQVSKEVLENLQRGQGFGIGLDYVKTALSTQYGPGEWLQFENYDQGLAVMILLPFEGGENLCITL